MPDPEHVPADDVEILPPGTRPPSVAPITLEKWQHATIDTLDDRLRRTAEQIRQRRWTS